MQLTARAFIRLMRPHQWLKNGFVLLGILFARQWNDGALLGSVLLATLAFSLMSSAVYVVNDFVDRDYDARHPAKRHRPLASGQISIDAALTLAGALAGCALLLAFVVSPVALGLLLAYAALNLGYSNGLKNVVILDVFIIATGFMLRILTGTIGVGIAPSQWLLLCGLMVTLFLGFAKRRSEVAAFQAGQGNTRRVLHHYDLPHLDIMLAVCATSVVITYSLYTVNPATVALHHTTNLVYTVPLVLYGLFRYLYLVYSTGAGEDAALDLVRDRQLLITLAAWLTITMVLIS